MYIKANGAEIVQWPYDLNTLKGEGFTLPRKVSQETLNPFGVYVVTLADKPAYDPETQVLEKNSTPSLVEGSWVLGWTVRAKTAEEASQHRASQNQDVNSERDRRLMVGKSFTPTGHSTPVKVNILDGPNLTGLASIAIVQSGAGNGSTAVVWRDNENVNHTLTYDQVIELHGLAGQYTSSVYAAAWTLKDAETLPENFTDDIHWPE